MLSPHAVLAQDDGRFLQGDLTPSHHSPSDDECPVPRVTISILFFGDSRRLVSSFPLVQPSLLDGPLCDNVESTPCATHAHTSTHSLLLFLSCPTWRPVSEPLAVPYTPHALPAVSPHITEVASVILIHLALFSTPHHYFCLLPITLVYAQLPLHCFILVGF